MDKIYRNSNRILCSSNGFVNNIASRGVPKDKLIFWPQFCESIDFTKLTKPELYQDDCFNVVFAGNIGDAQGLDLMLSAAVLLKDCPVRWFLVGDGRAKDRLKQSAKDNGLEKSVIFIDRVPECEAYRYIHFADCAYLSFKNCKLFDLTIPAKLQTYLACGVPILGAVGGESAEIIKCADCGIVSDRTAEAVCDAINKLIIMPPYQKRAYKANAIRYFESNYSVSNLISQLLHEMESQE